MALADAPAAESILAAVGEVVYDWSIPDDTIAWGKNVTGGAQASLRSTNRNQGGLRRLSDPDDPESRHEAVLGAGGGNEDGRLPHRVPLPPRGTEGCATPVGSRTFAALDAGPDGRPLRAHGVIRIIDERHEREERLAFLSRHDELTGCLNRAHLVEVLDKVFQALTAGLLPSS